MTRILAVFLSFLLFPMSISVEACVFNPVPELSNAEKGYWSRHQTQHRHRQASERLALGHVDVSSELAELLIPNIRPVRIEKSSCGPLGEVDFANGEPRLFGEELYADRRLGKTSPRIMREKARTSTVGGVFGEACNLEFRQRFSAWLKGSIPEEKLQEIWKFLLARQRESGNYGSIYARLMAFEGETRQPPVRWVGADKWIDRDIRTFVTKRTNGRLLASAISSFWAAHQQLLSSDDLACPVAERSWEAEKERIIAAILSQERAVIPGAR